MPVMELDLCNTLVRDTTKIIYFPYFYSITKYGIIFWGNSSNSRNSLSGHYNNNNNNNNKNVRIMTGTKSSTSHKPLVKALEIMTLLSQYKLPSTTFLAHNLEY
jgi:hypothetical protein